MSAGRAVVAGLGFGVGLLLAAGLGLATTGAFAGPRVVSAFFRCLGL